MLDSRKVFAEGLNLASGIAVGFGGVWAGAAPDFLFANDSWSQFIAFQVGPEGQMVLLDWDDQAECHQQSAAVDRSNG